MESADVRAACLAQMRDQQRAASAAASPGGGQLDDRERDLAADEDIIATRRGHEIRFGLQSIASFVADYAPNRFDGARVFGGGSAPVLDAANSPTGPSSKIDGLETGDWEQYPPRAPLNLPGGTP